MRWITMKKFMIRRMGPISKVIHKTMLLQILVYVDN